jgi:hypothetical protein
MIRMIISFVILSLTQVLYSVANDDHLFNASALHELTCHRQAVQFCGKITKFFDHNTSRWRDGTQNRPALSCDDPHLNATAPVSAANCDVIFGRPFVVATVIGVAKFSDWCSSPHHCDDFGAGQPVVVCHEPLVDVSACCCDFGQYHATDFVAKCPESDQRMSSSSSSPGSQRSELGSLNHARQASRHGTFVHLAIVLGTTISIVVGFVILIGVFSWCSARRRRRAEIESNAIRLEGESP